VKLPGLPAGAASWRRVLVVGAHAEISSIWQYFGQDGKPGLAGIARFLTWWSRARLYRANPRPPSYMAVLVLGMARRWMPQAQLELIAEPAWIEGLSPAERPGLPTVGSLCRTRDGVRLELENPQATWDAVVCLFPDTIGRGWEPIEAALGRLDIPTRVVINGRGRIFTRDARTDRLLRQRRWLDRWPLPEVVMTLAIALTGGLLALKDVVLGPPAWRSRPRRRQRADPEQTSVTQHTSPPEVRQWWTDNPMTYGVEHGTSSYVRPDGSQQAVAFGSDQFFAQADDVFYRWNPALHPGGRPFSKIFDYDAYVGQNVLEVGCGMGCMAMNWGQQGAKLVAVDLNPVAVTTAQLRFRRRDLAVPVAQVDAQNLSFADGSFAFVYSWGVLHHSPRLRRSLREVHRVLRPGGSAGVMLYHRRSLLYRWMVKWNEGFLGLEDHFLDELALASRYSDGDRQEGNPHTWPITIKEIQEDLFTDFEELTVEVLGTDIPDILDSWFPKLGSRLLPRAVLDALSRRFGWSLWIVAKKGGS
jgi:SAM-dependent methyltransferase